MAKLLRNAGHISTLEIDWGFATNFLVWKPSSPHTVTVKKREQILDLLSSPRIGGTGRLCDAANCLNHGEYRAPKSREDLNNYYWFCLEHVRSYNARWNFYSGISQDGIEKQLRADATWWRPTWPLGSRVGNGDTPKINFGVFSADDWESMGACTHSPNPKEAGWRPRPGSVEAKAMAVFDLDTPITRSDIKERYKALVKKYHPDTHGGDRDAEERLKIINHAYSALMACSEI